MRHELRKSEFETVVAEINFVVPSESKPQIFVDENGEKGFRYELSREARAVAVRNIRPVKNEFELMRDGLKFLRQETSISDFTCFKDLRCLYDSELVTLLREQANAKKVIVFDHTLRLDDGNETDRKPVRHAHGDYTRNSGPQRLLDLLSEAEAANWTQRHYGIINIWRPINGRVETAPLAFVEPHTLAPGDLVETDLIYPDRTGEIFELAFNPNHSWIFLADQEIEEVTIFKTFDSADGYRQKVAPHTAFDLPESGCVVRPRQSIESRALVLFE